MFKALKRMPVYLAVLIMVILMFGGVVLGNANALENASAPAWHQLSSLQTDVAQMSNRASNYLVIAGRLGITGENVDAVKSAQASANAMANKEVSSLGKTAARQIQDSANALDQAITALDAEMKTVIQKLDNANEARIEEEARKSAYDQWVDNCLGITQRKNYDEIAMSAREVYRKLPTRALLSNRLPPTFD